jgi:hypothetical protein
VRCFTASKVLIPTTETDLETYTVLHSDRLLFFGSKVLASRLIKIPTDIEAISANILIYNTHTFLTGLSFESKAEGKINIRFF